MRRTLLYRMLRPLMTTILVMIYAMPMAFARVVVTWYCEGRACGYTPSFCCCDTSVNRDPKCSPAADQAGSPADEGRQGLCAAQCDCRMIIGTSDGPPAVDIAKVSPVYPQLAALPPSAPLVMPAPFICSYAVAPVEARGPPAASRFAFAPASPRAPPLA